MKTLSRKLLSLFLLFIPALALFAPPARSENIRVAFGSCIQHDKPEVWESIQRTKPAFFALLGDTIYLDQEKLSNRHAITSQHEKLFRNPGFSRLLSSLPTFAIWDDHDFGPNGADSLFRGSALTRSIFLSYWNSVNARSAKMLGGGLEKFAPGTKSLAFALTYKRILFLFTDGRSYRISPASVRRGKSPGPATMFGEKQFQWLERKIQFSNEQLIVILSGSQILPSTPQGDNLATFPEERERLLAIVGRSRIPIVFLSGDMHFAETLVRKTGRWNAIELTSSPLAGGLAPGSKAIMQPHRKGLIIGQENFGLLEINTNKVPVAIRGSIHAQKGGKILQLLASVGGRNPGKNRKPQRKPQRKPARH